MQEVLTTARRNSEPVRRTYTVRTHGDAHTRPTEQAADEVAFEACLRMTRTMLACIKQVALLHCGPVM